MSSLWVRPLDPVGQQGQLLSRARVADAGPPSTSDMPQSGDSCLQFLKCFGGFQRGVFTRGVNLNNWGLCRASLLNPV